MKSISIAVLMAVFGSAQADEPQICGSAIEATVNFMTSTYGVDADSILVQVLSAKRGQKDSMILADTIASAGNHRCALKLSPTTPRKGTPYICQWSINVASCDSPEISKREIIDEPSWVIEKARAKAWKNGVQKNLGVNIPPTESKEQ
jgi:hypothetical protein